MTTALCDVIKDRLEIKPKNEIEAKEELVKALQDNEYHRNYIGFDMSGYGFGDDEITFLARERCRINNWIILIDNFRDYLPTMTIDNFKLHCWKGSIWWGDDDYEPELTINNQIFSGYSTAHIIEWIIKKYGIRKED